MTVHDEPAGNVGAVSAHKTPVYEILAEKILAAAAEVHSVLGPGLFQSVYEKALIHELSYRNISFQDQVAIPLIYKGVDLQFGFRLDLVVEDAVILEIKSIEQILPVHEAQLLTYMKSANKHLGFIMNFNVPVLKQGIIKKIL